MTKYYAHIFYWSGKEDVEEIDKSEIEDLLIAVERQAYVRFDNEIINGSLVRKIDILTVEE